MIAGSPPRPFYFGPPDHPLFGWYHPSLAPPRGRGLVLCNPLGLEMTRAHRSYRHLAERLAAAGFAVLRFDYHGTGDSSGDERDPDRVATWLADIHLAVEELRRQSGARSIGLVGLRAGATLAAEVAAERGDLDPLVLWAPSPSGSAWASEMVKLHKLYLRITPQEGAPEPGGEELLGSFLSHQSIADLGRIALLALARPPARRILVVDDGALRERDRLQGHLRSLGSEVEWRLHPGQKFLVTVPHRAALPEEVLDAIVAWLGALPSDDGAAPPTREATPGTPFSERPLFFGPAGGEASRFAIYVPPASTRARPGRPGILLANAGTVNRVGPHRSYVTLARRWAALGFPVLRVDLSGIGDSPAAEGTPENLTYPRDRYEDVSDALDLLARESGAARFIVAGLCSGADIAFQMARRDDRLAGAVMMNPRTFLELDLDEVERQDPTRCAPTPTSTDAARRVPAMLREITHRSVDALLVVSARDPGIDFVDRLAPDAMRAALELPSFRRVDVPGTDHTFTTLAAQRRVADLLTNEYLARHLDPP